MGRFGRIRRQVVPWRGLGQSSYLFSLLLCAQCLAHDRDPVHVCATNRWIYEIHNFGIAVFYLGKDLGVGMSRSRRGQTRPERVCIRKTYKTTIGIVYRGPAVPGFGIGI